VSSTHDSPKVRSVVMTTLVGPRYGRHGVGRNTGCDTGCDTGHAWGGAPDWRRIAQSGRRSVPLSSRCIELWMRPFAPFI